MDSAVSAAERHRRREPLIRVGPRSWVTAHHGTAALVFRDARFGVLAKPDLPDVHVSPTLDANPIWHLPLSPSLLDSDPPRHTRLRSLVAAHFSAESVLRLQQGISDEVNLALTRCLEAQDVDLLQDFALPISIGVIARVMGLPPSDWAQIAEWGSVVSAGLDGFRTQSEEAVLSNASTGLRSYFEHVIEGRTGSTRPDAIQALIDGKRKSLISHEELLATCILLLVAGFETTKSLLAGAMATLLQHPAEYQEMATELSSVPAAVDEMLRYESPVALRGRVALEDVKLEGNAMIPAGGRIAVLVAAANRDPNVFGEPNNLILHRNNVTRHLAFGLGRHYCLGATLARTEAVTALTGLLGRTIAISPNGPVVGGSAQAVRGPRSVPVRLSPA